MEGIEFREKYRMFDKETATTSGENNYTKSIKIMTKESNELSIDSAMKAEIEAAVNFLTDFLVKSPNKEFSTESVDLFRSSLQSVLYRRYNGHWHSLNPSKGSAFRCLRINGKLDPLLAIAAESCRLPLRKVRQAFPAELTVWVDPGDVSVRFGEEGSVGVWYAAQRTSDAEDEQRQQKIRSLQHDQIYQQRNSPTLSTTPPGVNHHHSYHNRFQQYQTSPVIQYQRQQSSPVWNPQWQTPTYHHHHHQHRSSPSSIGTTAVNNGFMMALNHQQQQQMQMRQHQRTPVRFNGISLSSSPPRISPQPITIESNENGEEQHCKMLAERLMRENLNLMASIAPGLASSRPQPVGVGVN